MDKIINKLIVQFKDGNCYKGNVRSLKVAKERSKDLEQEKILFSEWYNERGKKTILIKEKKVKKLTKKKIAKKK